MDCLNVLCINLRGSSSDKANFLRAILSLRPPSTTCHAVLAQELSSSSLHTRFLEGSFSRHSLITAFPPVGTARRGLREGVGVFVSEPATPLLVHPRAHRTGHGGRVVATLLRAGRHLLCLVSHYGMSAPYHRDNLAKSIAILEDLESLLADVRSSFPSAVFVIGGDFNFDPDSVQGQSLPCFPVFQRLIARFGLHDLRSVSGTGLTYPAVNPVHRLDLFLVSAAIVPYCSLSLNPSVVNRVVSSLPQNNLINFDHIPLFLRIRVLDISLAGTLPMLAPGGVPRRDGAAAGTRSQSHQSAPASNPLPLPPPFVPRRVQVAPSRSGPVVCWPHHIIASCRMQQAFSARITEALRCVVSDSVSGAPPDEIGLRIQRAFDSAADAFAHPRPRYCPRVRSVRTLMRRRAALRDAVASYAGAQPPTRVTAELTAALRIVPHLQPPDFTSVAAIQQWRVYASALAVQAATDAQTRSAAVIAAQRAKRDRRLDQVFERSGCSASLGLLDSILDRPRDSQPIRAVCQGGTMILDPAAVRIATRDHFRGISGVASDYQLDPAALGLIYPREERLCVAGASLCHSVSVAELQAALAGVNARSAPGPDRIPPIALQLLPPAALGHLAALLSALLAKGVCPGSWRESVVTPILKSADSDASLLTERRPIAVQSVLARLLSRVLARRLGAILDPVLSRSQQAFLPSSSIHYNHQLLRCMLEDSMQFRRDFFLVQADIAKAFDTVEREYMWHTLEWLGLPAPFIAYVQSMYSEHRIRIRTAHGETEPFVQQRGILQGCPLSPLLFLCCLEPLLRKVDSAGLGYTLSHPGLPAGAPAPSVSALAFADDASFPCCSARHAQSILDLLEEFCRLSGFSLSVDKSVVFARASTGLPNLTYRGRLVPYMTDVDASWKYLGGSFTLRLRESLSARLLADVHAVFSRVSGVVADGRSAPTLQHLSAIAQSFLLPRVTFHVLSTNGGAVSLSDITAAEVQLRAYARHIAAVDKGLVSEAYSLPHSLGGVGLPDLLSHAKRTLLDDFRTHAYTDSVCARALSARLACMQHELRLPSFPLSAPHLDAIAGAAAPSGYFRYYHTLAQVLQSAQLRLGPPSHYLPVCHSPLVDQFFSAEEARLHRSRAELRSISEIAELRRISAATLEVPRPYQHLLDSALADLPAARAFMCPALRSPPIAMSVVTVTGDLALLPPAVNVHLDGSHMPGSESGGAAAWVVSADEVEYFARSVRTPIGTNSFTAELFAVYDALSTLPPLPSVVLHIDNAAVLSLLLEPNSTRHGRSALRHAELDLIVAVQAAYARRAGSVSAVKVKAHSGVRFNERADALARAALCSGALPSVQLHHLTVGSGLLRYADCSDVDPSVHEDVAISLCSVHLSSRAIFRMSSVSDLLRGRSEKPVQGACCRITPEPLHRWIAAAGQLASSPLPRLHCAHSLSGTEWREHGAFMLRFVHRILPTRAHLAHLDSDVSAKCPHCAADETFSHIFAESGCAAYADARGRMRRAVMKHFRALGVLPLSASVLAVVLTTLSPDRCPPLLFDVCEFLRCAPPPASTALVAALDRLTPKAKKGFWAAVSTTLVQELHWWFNSRP